MKYTESCNADPLIDLATGKLLNYLARWTGETRSDSVIARVNAVSGARTTYQWLTAYLPLLLGMVGAALVGGLKKVIQGGSSRSGSVRTAQLKLNKRAIAVKIGSFSG